jgi:N-acyl-D-amino-acid deacylase
MNFGLCECASWDILGPQENAMDAEFDLVIRGGQIVDGSGGEIFSGDVAVKEGRIAEVGRRIAGSGREEIDAKGLAVTPGFVDVHTHYDGQVSWDNRLTPSSHHGVTTAVMGNCGVGFAPCKPHERDNLIRLMEGVEDIPFPVLAEGLPWTWESFPQYLDAADSIPHDIDFAAYVPHAALRVYVMGERAVNQEPAAEADRAAMAKLLQEGVKSGGMGFGTSQTIIHRSSDGLPIPTLAAEEAEYMAMAMALKEIDQGIIQFVLDWDRPVPGFGMLERLAEASGRPLTYSLAQGHSNPNRWREPLAQTRAAVERGLTMKAQVLPRPVGFLLSHALTLNPFYSTPTYERLSTLPFEQRIAELRKPEVRARILSETNDPDPKNKLGLRVRNFSDMYPLGEPPNYEPPAETSILAQAKARGVTPEELVYDLLLERDGRNIMFLAAANYADKNLDHAAEMVRHQDTVVGLGDGGAHLGTVCDATFTTSMLLEWPKERPGGVRMDLAGTIRELARKPAELMGFLDRGLVAPGLRADLNLIDLDRLLLRRPEIIVDLPAGGRRLMQRAEGYAATLVAGQVIQREGRATEALPGRLVRGPQAPPTVN